MGGMTFSAVQTGAKAGGGEHYLPKRALLAAKIKTSKEVSPHVTLRLKSMVNGRETCTCRFHALFCGTILGVKHVHADFAPL